MAHTGCGGCPQACQPCLRQALGIQMFNIHPGTTSGLCEPEVSMRGIAAGINRALGETRGVCVVLENVAGQARAPPLAPRANAPVGDGARLLSVNRMQACWVLARGARPLGGALCAGGWSACCVPEAGLLAVCRSTGLL